MTFRALSAAVFLLVLSACGDETVTAATPEAEAALGLPPGPGAGGGVFIEDPARCWAACAAELRACRLANTTVGPNGVLKPCDFLYSECTDNCPAIP